MRRASITTALTKGVLDPDLSERVDLAHYFSSLAAAPNTLFTPQGGAEDRGGTRDEGAYRNRLWLKHINSSNVTAPNGGNAGYAVDRDYANRLVTADITSSNFVVIEIDLADVFAIAAIDVSGFKAELSSSSDALIVEYRSGSDWIQFAAAHSAGVAKNVTTAERNVRFSGPPGYAVSARYWRVVVKGMIGAGTFSLAHVRLFRHSTVASPIRSVNLAHPRGQFELAFGDRNVDVFLGGSHVASITGVDIDAQQVRELAFVTSRDSVLVFHEQIRSLQFIREGADNEWGLRALSFANVPALPAGATVSGAANEIQRLSIPGIQVGDIATLYLGYEHTATLQFNGSSANFANEIRDALEQTDMIGVGGVSVAVIADRSWSISMRPAGGQRSLPLVSASVADSVAVPSTTVTQIGSPGSGQIISANTGYPRCAAIWQGRMIMGGFRLAPATLIASRAGDFLDLQTTGSPLTADLAFMRTIDTDILETITTIYAGRHIQIFTDRQEWYIEARALDATKDIPIVPTNRNGIERGVPVVFVEGATVFMQTGGQTLREMLFSDVELSYRSEPLSLLAPHLLAGVSDMAARRARSVGDGNLVFMVNSDGSAAALTMLRSQEVAAMSPWRPAIGDFRGVMCDADDDVRFVVEVDGQMRRWRWARDYPLDGQVRFLGSGLSVISGLPSYMEGRVVYAYVDGGLDGPFTVAGGAITLSKPGDFVVVGLEPEWFLRGQPLRERLSDAQPFRPPMRIYEVELALRDTGGLTIGTNGRPREDVSLLTAQGFEDGGPLQSGGHPADVMMARLYTGNRRLGGLLGWTEHPYVEIGRPGPVPVHVKSIRYEVAHHG